MDRPTNQPPNFHNKPTNSFFSPKKQGWPHHFTLKNYYLKANLEELWKLKYISPCKNNKIFQKKKSFL